jgi:hypothetical protein
MDKWNTFWLIAAFVFGTISAGAIKTWIDTRNDGVTPIAAAPLKVECSRDAKTWRPADGAADEDCDFVRITRTAHDSGVEFQLPRAGRR